MRPLTASADKATTRVVTIDYRLSTTNSTLLEQRVERLACVVGRLWLAVLVGGEVANDLGLVERALVACVLRGDARRDVLAALPHRGGVEEAAVAAGVQIGPALHASLIGGRLLDAPALVPPPVALEDLRAPTPP